MDEQLWKKQQSIHKKALFDLSVLQKDEYHRKKLVSKY